MRGMDCGNASIAFSRGHPQGASMTLNGKARRPEIMRGLILGRRRHRHPCVRSNFTKWADRTVVHRHDRASSVRQHRTRHTLVKEACGVVARARDLLGRRSRADAETVCSRQPGASLPFDHAGPMWCAPKRNSAQVFDRQQPDLFRRQDSVHAEIAVQGVPHFTTPRVGVTPKTRSAFARSRVTCVQGITSTCFI
jgi:hypothetical protein